VDKEPPRVCSAREQYDPMTKRCAVARALDQAAAIDDWGITASFERSYPQGLDIAILWFIRNG
jgi:hypothetical protein